MQSKEVERIVRILTEDDRSHFRRQIVVAIVGVAIGALTTLFTKIIESEYQYQRNLKVIEYKDSCVPDFSMHNMQAVICKLTLSARGHDEIKQIRLSITTVGVEDSGAVPDVTPVELQTGPNFAPPDPPPQIDQSPSIKGFVALSLSRLREPQKVVWTVKITSDKRIDIDRQIQRVVSTADSRAMIEEGSTWRWTRWVALGSLGIIIPLVIICLLFVAMWSFRKPKERKNIVWE